MNSSVWKDGNFIKFRTDKEWCFPITSEGLCEASMAGCFPIVEWFLKNHIEFIQEEKSYYSRYSLFITACSMGNVDIARWMVKDYPALLTPFVAEEVLMMASTMGELEIMKWMYEQVPDAQIDCDHNFPFEMSLFLQNYNICDWLYQQHPNMEFDEMFVSICGDPRYDLEVLEYIYQKDNNIIHAKNSEGFITACAVRNVEVAKWIQSKDPEKFILELEDDIIQDWKVTMVVGNQIINNPEVCIVCYEKQSNMITRCGHQFCNVCICNVITLMDTVDCPYCRQRMTPLKRIKTE
jgi:hypothetical protein